MSPKSTLTDEPYRASEAVKAAALITSGVLLLS